VFVARAGSPSATDQASSLAHLAEHFDIHPNQITSWKALLQKGLRMFSGPGAVADPVSKFLRQHRQHHSRACRTGPARGAASSDFEGPSSLTVLTVLTVSGLDVCMTRSS
jgi:hypothetical protein